MGIILLVFILGLSITVMSRQNLEFDGPYPNVKSSTDSTVIARGKELVFGPAHCADCHSTVNADSLLALGQEVSLSGGYEFNMPIHLRIFLNRLISKIDAANMEYDCGNGYEMTNEMS